MTRDEFDEGRDLASAPPRGTKTMALVRWGLVVVMGLAAAASVSSYFGLSFGGTAGHKHGSQSLYYCPMHPQIVQDHPGECPICSMTLVPKPEGPIKASATMQAAPAAAQPTKAGDASAKGKGKYYCPMHPNVSSDDPNAKCDLCGGMKLMPRPAEAGEPAPMTEAVAAPVPGLVPVDIPVERVQKIGVRTAVAKRQSLANDLRAVGAIEASERGLTHVSPRFSGWIEKLAVQETGQKVARGQVLATIYSPDVLQAQQELLTALGWAGAAPGATGHHGGGAQIEGLADDARRRLELLGISRTEIDAIVKNRKLERAIAIRSPAEGYVIAKNAVEGMSVSPGMALFEIANLSSVWVMVDVHEGDVALVRIGQPARLEISAYPGETFAGKVQFIYPTLDPASRTLRVRIELRNKSGAGGLRLRPGMFGNVSLDLPGRSGLMVPAEAVVDTGDVQYVFVAKSAGRFEPRRVKVGTRLDDGVEILEGVAEGEAVVTTANFLIDSESRLHAAIEGQASVTPPSSGSSTGQGPNCDTEFDAQKYPQKQQSCRACEVQHRGMGTMEEDCKKAISKPWR